MLSSQEYLDKKRKKLKSKIKKLIQKGGTSESHARATFPKSILFKNTLVPCKVFACPYYTQPDEYEDQLIHILYKDLATGVEVTSPFEADYKKNTVYDQNKMRNDNTKDLPPMTIFETSRCLLILSLILLQKKNFVRKFKELCDDSSIKSHVRRIIRETILITSCTPTSANTYPFPPLPGSIPNHGEKLALHNLRKSDYNMFIQTILNDRDQLLYVMDEECIEEFYIIILIQIVFVKNFNLIDMYISYSKLLHDNHFVDILLSKIDTDYLEKLPHNDIDEVNHNLLFARNIALDTFSLTDIRGYPSTRVAVLTTTAEIIAAAGEKAGREAIEDATAAGKNPFQISGAELAARRAAVTAKTAELTAIPLIAKVNINKPLHVSDPLVNLNNISDIHNFFIIFLSFITNTDVTSDNDNLFRCNIRDDAPHFTNVIFNQLITTYRALPYEIQPSELMDDLCSLFKYSLNKHYFIKLLSGTYKNIHYVYNRYFLPEFQRTDYKTLQKLYDDFKGTQIHTSTIGRQYVEEIKQNLTASIVNIKKLNGDADTAFDAFKALINLHPPPPVVPNTESPIFNIGALLGYIKKMRTSFVNQIGTSEQFIADSYANQTAFTAELNDSIDKMEQILQTMEELKNLLDAVKDQMKENLQPIEEFKARLKIKFIPQRLLVRPQGGTPESVNPVDQALLNQKTNEFHDKIAQIKPSMAILAAYMTDPSNPTNQNAMKAVVDNLLKLGGGTNTKDKNQDIILNGKININKINKDINKINNTKGIDKIKIMRKYINRINNNMNIMNNMNNMNNMKGGTLDQSLDNYAQIINILDTRYARLLNTITESTGILVKYEALWMKFQNHILLMSGTVGLSLKRPYYTNLTLSSIDFYKLIVDKICDTLKLENRGDKFEQIISKQHQEYSFECLQIYLQSLSKYLNSIDYQKPLCDYWEFKQQLKFTNENEDESEEHTYNIHTPSDEIQHKNIIIFDAAEVEEFTMANVKGKNKPTSSGTKKHIITEAVGDGTLLLCSIINIYIKNIECCVFMEYNLYSDNIKQFYFELRRVLFAEYIEILSDVHDKANQPNLLFLLDLVSAIKKHHETTKIIDMFIYLTKNVEHIKQFINLLSSFNSYELIDFNNYINKNLVDLPSELTNMQRTRAAMLSAVPSKPTNYIDSKILDISEKIRKNTVVNVEIPRNVDTFRSRSYTKVTTFRNYMINNVLSYATLNTFLYQYETPFFIDNTSLDQLIDIYTYILELIQAPKSLVIGSVYNDLLKNNLLSLVISTSALNLTHIKQSHSSNQQSIIDIIYDSFVDILCNELNKHMSVATFKNKLVAVIGMIRGFNFTSHIRIFCKYNNIRSNINDFITATTLHLVLATVLSIQEPLNKTPDYYKVALSSITNNWYSNNQENFQNIDADEIIESFLVTLSSVLADRNKYYDASKLYYGRKLLNVLKPVIDKYLTDIHFAENKVQLMLRLNDISTINAPIFNIKDNQLVITQDNKCQAKLKEAMNRLTVSYKMPIDFKNMIEEFKFTPPLYDKTYKRNASIARASGINRILSPDKHVELIANGYSGVGKTYALLGSSNEEELGIVQEIFSLLAVTDIYMRAIEIEGVGVPYRYYWNLSNIKKNIFYYNIQGDNVKVESIDEADLINQYKTFSITKFDTDPSKFSSWMRLNKNEFAKFSEYIDKIDVIRKREGRIGKTKNNPESSRSLIIYDFKTEIPNPQMPGTKIPISLSVHDLPGLEDIKNTYSDLKFKNEGEYNFHQKTDQNIANFTEAEARELLIMNPMMICFLPVVAHKFFTFMQPHKHKMNGFGVCSTSTDTSTGNVTLEINNLESIDMSKQIVINKPTTYNRKQSTELFSSLHYMSWLIYTNNIDLLLDFYYKEIFVNTTKQKINMIFQGYFINELVKGKISDTFKKINPGKPTPYDQVVINKYNTDNKFITTILDKSTSPPQTITVNSKVNEITMPPYKDLNELRSITMYYVNLLLLLYNTTTSSDIIDTVNIRLREHIKLYDFVQRYSENNPLEKIMNMYDNLDIYNAVLMIIQNTIDKDDDTSYDCDKIMNQLSLLITTQHLYK